MAQRKIITNDSGSTATYGGKTLADQESYELSKFEWVRWAADNNIHNAISSGDLLVGNGSENFDVELGLAHIQNPPGIIREHSDVTLLPGFGENAPEIVRISPALIGFCMRNADEIFGETRLNNYAGGDVQFQLHLAIDNSTADRWIQFDVHYWTTNGLDDKPANVESGTLQMGPVEVPTTPWLVFEEEVSIPASEFANGEKYLFVSIERVTATGKTAPANHPTVLRYCKKFYRVDES